MNSNNSTEVAGKAITDVANGMLSGSINYLEGAQQLITLREQVGAYANDPDFMPFIAIIAEIKTLSCETKNIGWTKKGSPTEKLEIAKSVEWAKSFSLNQCEALANRYSV